MSCPPEGCEKVRDMDAGARIFHLRTAVASLDTCDSADVAKCRVKTEKKSRQSKKDGKLPHPIIPYDEAVKTNN